ncbi:MAG: CofH family radical SAM protein [Candidatus Omnitrophota bacterium]|jgi:aminodeoxyfutalosine synthase
MDFDFHPFEDIAEKISAGQRLSFEDGVRLYQSEDLPVLGALAQEVRRRLNGRRVVYSLNLHLNYTNLCADNCRFCSFAKKPGEEGGYVLNPGEIASAVREAVMEWQINEVHLVGGHHPTWGLEDYLAILRAIRSAGPSVYIKAFAAPEIAHIARLSGLAPAELLRRFQAEGLNGLPGGGAEIFSEEVRKKICPNKISAGEWLEIHRLAHGLGLRTNATMLYGHIENGEDRVEHVLRLRALQDETGGFQAFIPLCYQARRNALESLGTCGGFTDLKVFAVSRLLLDNVPHLKAHWVGLGLKMAQVSLSFGVDDLGGVHLGEKIFRETGETPRAELDRGGMERLIRSAGYEPCLVDSAYSVASENADG